MSKFARGGNNNFYKISIKDSILKGKSKSENYNISDLEDNKTYIFRIFLTAHTKNNKSYISESRAIIKIIDGRATLLNNISVIDEHGTGWNISCIEEDNFLCFVVNNNNDFDGVYSLSIEKTKLNSSFIWSPGQISSVIAWYEPEILFSLKQPVGENNGPVKGVNNLISGYEQWKLISKLSNHPERVDGESENGKRILRSNANSMMQTSVLNQTQPVHVFMRLKINSIKNDLSLFYDSAEINYGFSAGLSNSKFMVKGNNAEIIEANVNLNIIDTWMTVESFWSGNKSFLKINSEAIISENFGNNQPKGITIFSRQDGTKDFSDIDLSCLVISNREIVGDDLNKLKKYMTET